MNWTQHAKKAGWTKATIRMTRVPVYASPQPTAQKETTQTAYIESPDTQRTGVVWGNVLGTLSKNQDGDWATINTDRARYEVESVELAS